MFSFKGFSHPKDPQSGNLEDAWRADPQQGVLVVSDGASSSLFSSLWANILCDGVLEEFPNPKDHFDFPKWLERLRNKWAANIDCEKLSWFQKPKLAEGSFATLVCVQVESTLEIPPDLGDDTPLDYPFFRISGFALGDACLIQFRKGKLLRSIPVERSADFDSTPMLLGSVSHGKDLALNFVSIDFTAPAGDWIVLATDAMSQWILSECENGRIPQWSQFWDTTDEQFGQYIEYLRSGQQIRIDDTTAVASCLGGMEYIEWETPASENSNVQNEQIDGNTNAAAGALPEAPRSSETEFISPQEITIDSAEPVSSMDLPGANTAPPVPVSEESTLRISSVRVSPPSGVPLATPPKKEAAGQAGRPLNSGAQVSPPPAAPVAEIAVDLEDVSLPEGEFNTQIKFDAQPTLGLKPPKKTGTLSSKPLSDRRLNQNPEQPLLRQPPVSSRQKIHPVEENIVPPLPSDDEDEYKIAMPEPSEQKPQKTQYLSRIEKQVQDKMDQEEREKKEKEDSFSYQFQQGMSEGIQDMKEGLRDVLNGPMGEQAKEALEKGKEKIAGLWNKWFKKQ